VATHPTISQARDGGYPGPVVLGAAIATVFFPVISLIAALMLRGGERNLRKRSQLKTWAWASFAFLAVQALFFVTLLLGLAAGGSGVGTY
jgi:cytochrome bd-type quinol oxidase subunit 2